MEAFPDPQKALSLLQNKESFIQYANECHLDGTQLYQQLTQKSFGTFTLSDTDEEYLQDEQYMDREWYSENAFDPSTHPIANYKSHKRRHMESEYAKWENNRLANSGLVKRHADTLDEEERAHLIVHDILPPFLDGAPMEDIGMVSVVKDPKSDMATLAKRGSQLVQRTREQNELQDKQDQAIQKKPMPSTPAQVQQDTQKVIALQKRHLPIHSVKPKLLQIIKENQITVIVGETGSGKTTQLAQFLYEQGHTYIGCTQPRRVAALSVAQRVADEMEVPVGDLVGYAIRFEDKTGPNTKIKFMTDGILLRECLQMSEISKYSAIILDEAHERNLNTDVLMGVLKQYCTKRPDFKLIVTSATLNAHKFSLFFHHCPIFHIPGRTFPVDVFYAKAPCSDYVESTVKQVMAIHQHMGKGDILCFLTGQEDIQVTCQSIQERLDTEQCAPLDILPIYSQLPSDLQARIFLPSPNRKVIVATNIAETSLTIDGIRYTVDTGFCKLKVYNPRLGLDTLQVTPISQANANQRKGRAGRTSHGYCYRLFTEIQFEKELLDFTVPEIQRTNLSSVILLLKSLHIEDVYAFSFMDAPPRAAISHSLYELWLLGALDDKQQLTTLGTMMLQYPLEPALSKMIVMGHYLDCLEEIIVIVAMLSVPHCFYRPKERMEEADKMRERFLVPESDHLTLLQVYQQFIRNGEKEKWCLKHFLHYKPLLKAKEIVEQLTELCTSQQLAINSNSFETIRKAICASYFYHTAKSKSFTEYINVRSGVSCFIHPTSAISSMGALPDYVVYHELLFTAKEYMQVVTSVKPQWLCEFGPRFYSVKNQFIKPFEMPIPAASTTIDFIAPQESAIKTRKKRRQF